MRKLIIQACLTTHSYGKKNYDAGFLSCNHDMLRLTYPRHSAYARAHQYDYWHVQGSLLPDMKGGGYDKIELIRRAMEYGYEYIAWVDADAAIMDFGVDLLDAIPEDKALGACLHDPEKSAYLKQYNVPQHYNVGVSYYRNTPEAQQFIIDWFATYPGKERWQEQGSYNDLIERPEYAAIFHRCDDKFNATIAVNEVEKPVVKGWHGVMPISRRLDMMRKELKTDYLDFRMR